MKNEINEYGLPEIFRDGLEETEYNHRVKYRNLYLRLIERCKNMTPEELSGYNEKHHILPRCMKGDDSLSNILKLPVRYHVMAHLILFEAYPDHKGIAYSVHCMTNGITKERTESIQKHFSSKVISEAKERAYKIMFTEEKRKEMSKAFSGENNPRYGNHEPLSEETKKKISETLLKRDHHLRGKHLPEEIKRKISKSLSGENHPLYGKKRSEETRKRISEAKLGEKNPMYGKDFSEETRKKMSLSRLGKPRSEETRKKIVESNRKRARSVIGPDGTIYSCIPEAVEATGLLYSTIRYLLQTAKDSKGWSYYNKENNN